MPQTVVIVVGGLGASQMADIFAALQATGAILWTPGGNNQMSADVWPTIEQYPDARLCFIGHSLGCKTVLNAANALAEKGTPADYVCIIEDVWGWDVKPGCLNWDWFQGDFLIDFPHAQIPGAAPIIITGCGHNDIAHDSRVIAAIVARVNAVMA